MKNIFNGLIIRVDMAEERISKLEDIPVETIQTKLQRKKKEQNNKRRKCNFKRLGSPRWFSGKESTCNLGDAGLIPESGRCSGEGNSNPLQFSCLKIPWTEEPGKLESVGSQKELDMT